MCLWPASLLVCIFHYISFGDSAPNYANPVFKCLRDASPNTVKSRLNDRQQMHNYEGEGLNNDVAHVVNFFLIFSGALKVDACTSASIKKILLNK